MENTDVEEKTVKVLIKLKKNALPLEDMPANMKVRELKNYVEEQSWDAPKATVPGPSSKWHYRINGTEVNDDDELSKYAIENLDIKPVVAFDVSPPDGCLKKIK